MNECSSFYQLSEDIKITLQQTYNAGNCRLGWTA